MFLSQATVVVKLDGASNIARARAGILSATASYPCERQCTANIADSSDKWRENSIFDVRRQATSCRES